MGPIWDTIQGEKGEFRGAREKKRHLSFTSLGIEPENTSRLSYLFNLMNSENCLWLQPLLWSSQIAVWGLDPAALTNSNARPWLLVTQGMWASSPVPGPEFLKATVLSRMAQIKGCCSDLVETVHGRAPRPSSQCKLVLTVASLFTTWHWESPSFCFSFTAT